MTKHPPPVLCQKTRANLKSKERENSAIKREKNALFFVKGGEETEVNKKRKQCTVLCLLCQRSEERRVGKECA